MVEESERAARRWRDGEVIDASQHMMDLTLAIVSRTLFSTDLGAEVAELTESINRIMNLYHYLVLLPAVEILVQLRAPKVGRFARERAKLDQIVYRMIAEHRKSRSIRADRGGDLLDMMIAAEEDDSPETNERLRDQVTTIFLAGYETVANALTWTWYLLDQNQDARRLLHAELDQVLKGRSPGIDDLPNLRYTEMVLAESMRLFPPAWAMGRKAIKDFDLGPYRLPAKTTVLMSQYVTHREEKFFPDPLRFDPERFSPAAKAQRPKFAYFPFGAGGRQCIGESFAWMECVLVLATLAQKWKLTLVPGHKVQPEPLITLRPKYGMRMRLEARHSRTGNDSARSAVHQRDGQPV
jgi:cytochrome P450